ncbi:MAG TPA: serine/threonine-protein kinase, partial [bacterium]|nr:serine/threonine-protein kinase [bacterium]
MAVGPGVPVPYGRYLLLSRLAIGGMAEVWLATTSGDAAGKPLVLKRILPQFAADPEFVARFREEALLSLSLVHGNIVPVFEVGSVGDDAFIAMEHVPGHDLRSVLKRARETGQRPPPGVAAWIVAEVLRGLDYAHRKTDPSGKPLGLVHRDVTPSNVVVSREGTVKLLDFGIAKAFGRDATRTGVLRGKVGYMSPEQARGEAIGAQSDLFSTGVVLYELLTAERLFDGDSEPAILERVKTQAIPRVRDKVPAVPPELDAIVARALERDPRERFPDAGEFHVALARVLFGGALRADAPAVASYLRDLFPEDLSAAVEEPESPERTATRAPGASQIGPGPALVLGGAPAAAAPAAATSRGASPMLWALGGAAVAALALGVPQIVTLARGAGTPTPHPAAERGTVVVDSSVRGSAVLLDDVDTAQVTPAIVRAPAGHHRIVVRKAGYKDSVLEVDVGAEAVEENALQVPAERGIAVESVPAGALASIPGHPGCATPCTIDGLSGIDVVSLTVSKSGFRSATMRVKVAEATAPIHVPLEPLLAAATPAA